MADEAAALLDQREFMFRGRPYRVPPVPWDLAVRLVAVQDRLRAFPPATGPKAVLRELVTFVHLAKLLCRPAGRIRRLFWPIAPNPFRKASPHEVGELMGFFSACLITAGVASPKVTGSHGMFSPISRDSLYDALPGPGPTASRSHGRIS